MQDTRGSSLVELVFVMGLTLTILATAIAPGRETIDHARAVGAVRRLAGDFRLARMVAVTRGRSVGFRFERRGASYRMTRYEDGNGNGIRTADINRGVDPMTEPPRELHDQFPGVEFGIAEGVRSVDATQGFHEGDDPVRVGSSNILTFSPAGTSTSGTLYIRGRAARQFAVRVLGPTARIRVLEYRFPSSSWTEP